MIFLAAVLYTSFSGVFVSNISCVWSRAVIVCGRLQTMQMDIQHIFYKILYISIHIICIEILSTKLFYSFRNLKQCRKCFVKVHFAVQIVSEQCTGCIYMYVCMESVNNTAAHMDSICERYKQEERCLENPSTEATGCQNPVEVFV